MSNNNLSSLLPANEQKEKSTPSQDKYPIGLIEECFAIALPKVQETLQEPPYASCSQRDFIISQIARKTLWQYMQETYGLNATLGSQEIKKLQCHQKAIEILLQTNIHAQLIQERHAPFLLKEIADQEHKIGHIIGDLQREGSDIAHLPELKEAAENIFNQIVQTFEAHREDFSGVYFWKEAKRLWEENPTLRRTFGMNNMVYNRTLSLIELASGRHLPRRGERWRSKK